MKKDFSYGIIAVKYLKAIPYFLLVRHLKGHWGFPKGHKISNESDKQTARRELLEETGLKEIKILRAEPVIESYDFKDGDESIHKEVRYFVALAISHEFQPDMKEVMEVKWSILEEALKLLTFDTAKQTLTKVTQLI